MSLVLAETKDSLGVIVLNHPKMRNALYEELIDDITTMLEDFRLRSIRAVTLRAATDVKSWSASHYASELVSELPDRGLVPLRWGDPLRVLARVIQRVPHAGHRSD